MHTLRVRDVLKDRILVSRESARLLEDALRAAMPITTTTEVASTVKPVTVDFAGVEGIAPSFLDELLRIFESLLRPESDRTVRSLIVANPPTRLSLKFEAVARGHGMSIHAMPDGSWRMSNT